MASTTIAAGAGGLSISRPMSNPWLIAVSVMLATFMEVLDTSIASVALPHIAGNLSATNDEATWVLTSYLVANAIVLPASPWFSRRFGRKRFLLTCIVIFTVSSFACGAATSLGMILLARAIQGAGGGALQPLSQAILIESFPPDKRGLAMAVFALGVVVAPVIGPTLGGYLTDTYSWRWAFYINIPIGVLAMFMIMRFIEDPDYIKNAKPGRIDAIGFGLLALWLGCLQIVLDKGQEDDWFGANWIRWAVAILVISFVLFIVRELTAEKPLVDLRVFRHRNFMLGCVLIGLFGAALYALVTLLPLFYQELLGYTAFAAGWAVSPRGIGAILAMPIIGVSDRQTRQSLADRHRFCHVRRQRAALWPGQPGNLAVVVSVGGHPQRLRSGLYFCPVVDHHGRRPEERRNRQCQRPVQPAAQCGRKYRDRYGEYHPRPPRATASDRAGTYHHAQQRGCAEPIAPVATVLPAPGL